MSAYFSLSNLGGLIPLAVFWAMARVGRGKGLTWLESVLNTLPWWVAGVWVGSNILSFFEILRPGPSFLVWGVAGLGAFVWAKRQGVTTESARIRWPENGWERVVSAILVVLCLLSLVAALAAPPVNVDVLNYHGPRQLFWLEQGSLAHFLTINDRQLMMPPLAEVIGLQFMLLTGDDLAANLPQWFAYVFLILATVSVLKTMKVSRWGVGLGAVLMGCLPMAYLEASNGKNDLQAALWIVLLLREVVRAKERASGIVDHAGCRAGTILALGLLTKSTVFLYGPPLVVMGVMTWWQGDRKRARREVGIAVLLTLLLTLPFFARNTAWFGNPLGSQQSESGGEQANGAMSPALLASNLIRNATLHLSSPWAGWNETVERTAAWSHRVMGLSLEDDRNTLWTMRYGVAYGPDVETIAGAPWHFVLSIAALGWSLFSRWARRWRWLAVVIILMVLLNGLVLRWQPWGARLQLPLFAVGVVLIGGVVSTLRDSRQRWVAISGLVMAVGAWLPSWEEESRPLLTSPTLFQQTREQNMVRKWPNMAERNRAMIGMLAEANVRNVMVATIHDMSYPLLRELKRKQPEIKLWGAAADAATPPDAIVALELSQPLPLYYEFFSGKRYRLVGDFPGDGIYLPEAKVRELAWFERLPEFAGWSLESGLQFRLIQLAVDSEIEVAWMMEGEQANLFYSNDSEPVVFSGTVRSASLVQDEVIEVRLNDFRVGEFTLKAGSGRQRFELKLPPGNTGNRLTLVRTKSGGNEIDFLSLVVNQL